MLDNIADLLLTVSLLQIIFQFPAEFALTYMVPGTAVGVLVGDLLFFFMALRLAKVSGRKDVTAMPLGLDTPSTIGMVVFVLGDAFTRSKQGGASEFDAATYAWHIGICSIFLSGLFKLVCATVSGWVRRVVPRAGLLGSLTAVALVLISFIPLLDVMQFPIVGLISLAVILTTLVAHIPLPGRVPGALAALVSASVVFYVMRFGGWIESEPTLFDPAQGLLPTQWLTVFDFRWLDALADSLNYLPIVIPFALATVIGGIDCTESAAAVGDEYDTRSIIAVEGVATLVAALCGGVIQTTPYIGHPAYKAMGGRAAYTLATALFVGSAGLLGYFGYLYLWIPKAAIFTILIFIGLEITSQSFQATPKKHYAAVALACVPAMAKLVMIFAWQLVDLQGKTLDELGPPLSTQLQTMHMLASGFIITSMLWASTLAAVIDRKLRVAATFMLTAAICSFFGLMHSPLRSEQLLIATNLPDGIPEAAHGQTPLFLTTGYLLVALFFWGLAWYRKQSEEDVDER